MTRHSSRRHVSRRKYVLFAAMAFFIGATLALGCAEIAIRFILPHKNSHFFAQPKGYYVPDPLLDHRLSRHYPPTFMTGMDGVNPNLAYTNSLGMRDIEPPPPDGRNLRILVLGCSMTEGHGILSPDQPWPRRLQTILASDTACPPVTVMNGGVSGYNTFQEVEHGRRLAAEAKPDVLLLGYLGGMYAMWGRNSFGMAGQYRLHWDALWDANQLEHLRQTHSRPSLTLMEHSYLWRWLMLSRTNTDLDGRDYTERPYGNRFREASEAALRSYKTLGEELGIPAIVVYMPLTMEMDSYLAGRDIDPTQGQVRQICNDIDLPYINALPAMLRLFREKHDENKVTCSEVWAISEQDAHYNPRANMACAQAVAESLAPLLAAVRPASTFAEAPSSGYPQAP